LCDLSTVLGRDGIPAATSPPNIQPVKFGKLSLR
jgi:hypothetical protein